MAYPIESVSAAQAEHILRKNGASKDALDESTRAVFTISDSTVDRHGDTIDPEGWDFKHYHGQVLWSHNDQILPIGRTLDLWNEGGQIKALVEFTPESLNPFGHSVGKLVEAGYIKMSSVGFIPHEGGVSEERSGFSPAFDFKKQELVELTICNVGSNRNALAEGKNYEFVEEAGISDPPEEICKTDAAASDSLWLEDLSIHIQRVLNNE